MSLADMKAAYDYAKLKMNEATHNGQYEEAVKWESKMMELDAQIEKSVNLLEG
jgi:hypothetical protein